MRYWSAAKYNISGLNQPTIFTNKRSQHIEGSSVSPTETNFVLNKVFNAEALLCSGAETVKEVWI